MILDGQFMGTTPLDLTGVGRGIHEIVFKHVGYYDLPVPVFYNGTALVAFGPLQRILGLVQVSIAPSDADVTVAGQRVKPGIIRLPTGSFTVTADAFGFQAYKGTLDIATNATVNLDVNLPPADFSITKVFDWKKTVNPNLPWFFGALDITFDVSGPGSGKAVILDSQGTEVASQTLKDFTTWRQTFRANLKDASGTPLPDGRYTLVLTGNGASGGEDVKSLEFSVKR